MIFVRYDGKCCVILANFINCRAISNAVMLKNFVILTLRNDKLRKISRTKLVSGGSLEFFWTACSTMLMCHAEFELSLTSLVINF